MGGVVCLLKKEYAWVMVCAAPLLLCLFLKPGSPVYSTKCQECVCTNSTDNATHVNYIACTHVPCKISCSSVSGVPPFLPFSCLLYLLPIFKEAHGSMFISMICLQLKKKSSSLNCASHHDACSLYVRASPQVGCSSDPRTWPVAGTSL